MPPTSAPPQSLPRSRVWILAAAVGAFALLFASQKIYDPDTWWHLATGRWVMEHRLVPAHDIFSFATQDAPWVAYSWLPATGMYLVHAAGGATALVLTKALLVAAAFVLAFAFAVRAGVHPWLGAVALCVAAPLARFQFRERPQILMFALTALFYWLLAEPGAERRKRTWIVLGLAQVLWANVHGSFFLGIALAGALFTERLLQAAAAKLRGATDADLRGVALTAGLLAVLALGSFATPYGTDLIAQTLRDMFNLSVSRTFVNEEFQRLSPARYPGFVAFAAATAASFLAVGHRARPYVVAVFAGLALLAFGSVRFAAIAAFVFAFVLALNLQPALERLLSRWTARGALPRPRVVAGLLTGSLALFGALAFNASFGPGSEARFGLGVNESRFPGPAVQFLARAGFEGNLFNSWVHGGYALWHLPKAKDLVDGRALPAHLALLEQLSSMDRASLDRWVEAHDVKGALLQRDDGFLPLFADSPRYTRAFFDDRAVVYLRKDVAAGSNTASSGFRFIQPESYDPSYLVQYARGAQAAEAEAELRRAVADAPDSFTPRFLLGFFLEVQGRPEGLEHYVAAAGINPGLAYAHYDLGRRIGALAIGAGQPAKGEPFLREALKFKKDDPMLEALLGTLLYLQKKLPEAEERFRKAIALSPELPLALTNLGYLLADTQRAGQAVALFERARKAAPADEKAAYGLAFALEASGNRDGAAKAWREFLGAFPSSSWAPSARQHLIELGGRP